MDIQTSDTLHVSYRKSFPFNRFPDKSSKVLTIRETLSQCIFTCCQKHTQQTHRNPPTHVILTLLTHKAGYLYHRWSTSFHRLLISPLLSKYCISKWHPIDIQSISRHQPLLVVEFCSIYISLLVFCSVRCGLVTSSQLVSHYNIWFMTGSRHDNNDF